MQIPPEFLARLRCPTCRREVVQDDDRLVCTDAASRLAFPIRDGIPVMIADEAIALPTDEWEAVMGRQATESEQS